MADTSPIMSARSDSMHMAERHLSRLDYYLSSARLPSLVRWIQPSPVGPHGAIPDGIRILSKNAVRSTEATFTVVGEVSGEDFCLEPGAQFDGEAGIGWLDLVSTFRLKAPRHVAFSGLWERALYNLNYMVETSTFGDPVPHTVVDSRCLNLQRGTIAFSHRFVRELEEGEVRGDPLLDDARLDPRLNRGDKIVEHYAPENWGVEDPQADAELLDYANDARFCLRLLPLYVVGGQKPPLQPRHYDRLRGCLARVDFTVVDTAKTQTRVVRPMRVHNVDAVVSSVQILLPRGYDKFAICTWDGRDVNWS